MIDSDDIVHITQIEHLYGHLLDGRLWDRLDEVFTADAVFDLSRADLGAGRTGEIYRGLDAIRSLFRTTQHALAHHCSNVYVYVHGGEVRIASKFFAPGDGASMLSAHYDDVAVRTPDGWRLRYRAAVTRALTTDAAIGSSVLHG